jgi:hypothetical protein
MQKFSDLKIIFSNCLYKGSSWAITQDMLFKTIRSKVEEIEGIEFKGINCNSVRGDHNAFTITIVGVFYNFTQKPNRAGMIDLEMLTVSLLQTIPDLTFSEVRVNHTRHMSEFKGLHPQLARTY